MVKPVFTRAAWISAVILLAAALAVYAATHRPDTTLTFSVRDAISGGWVWNCTIMLQDRVIRSFYQSTAGPVGFEFSRLKPGQAELKVHAPSYEAVSLPVKIRPGRNVLDQPILMRGYEIPGLSRFVIFETLNRDGLTLDIRPVGTDGTAVLNHPCLDLRIGTRISVQVNNGNPVLERVDEGSSRGEELYRGTAEWSFDPLPETTFRYTGRISPARIRRHPAPYRVIDYLILLPDPRMISGPELDELLEESRIIEDMDDLASYLESRGKGRFRVFVLTSWNVEAPG